MNEEEFAVSPHLQEYPTFVEIYYIILYYIILYYIILYYIILYYIIFIC